MSQWRGTARGRIDFKAANRWAALVTRQLGAIALMIHKLLIKGGTTQCSKTTNGM